MILLVFLEASGIILNSDDSGALSDLILIVFTVSVFCSGVGSVVGCVFSCN